MRRHELLARTCAALRRPHLRRDHSSLRAHGQLSAGDLVVDLATRSAARAGRPLNLKPRTFTLLCHFVQHPRVIFSHDDLLRRLWPVAPGRNTRTVDVHVLWLRQQIEDDPRHPRRLRTLRKKGYRFEG